MTDVEEPSAADERRQKASSEVRSRAYSAVDAVALLLEDPARVTDQPIWKGATSTRRQARPITQLQAAVWLSRELHRRVDSAIRQARAAGESWEAIAAVLDVDGDHPYDRAVAAFEQALGGQVSARAFSYECGTCGGRVHDYGPFDPHPDDQEQGHTDDCKRRLARLAAWKEKHGDD